MEESGDKIQCACGSVVMKKNLKKHEETTKHKKGTGQVVPPKPKKEKPLKLDDPNAFGEDGEVTHPELDKKIGWIQPLTIPHKKKKAQLREETESEYSDSESEDDQPRPDNIYDEATLDTHAKLITAINLIVKGFEGVNDKLVTLARRYEELTTKINPSSQV
jgi:hypothetical protein